MNSLISTSKAYTVFISHSYQIQDNNWCPPGDHNECAAQQQTNPKGTAVRNLFFSSGFGATIMIRTIFVLCFAFCVFFSSLFRFDDAAGPAGGAVPADVDTDDREQPGGRSHQHRHQVQGQHY